MFTFLIFFCFSTNDFSIGNHSMVSNHPPTAFMQTAQTSSDLAGYTRFFYFEVLTRLLLLEPRFHQLAWQMFSGFTNPTLVPWLVGPRDFWKRFFYFTASTIFEMYFLGMILRGQEFDQPVGSSTDLI
jgi:hypothetical protein